MKALILDEPGGSPAELSTRDAPLPSAGAGEALVRVAAAAVHRSDVLNVIGMPITDYPRIPGRDFAGTIIEGPSDLIGTRCWGTGGGDLGFRRDGSHAEYVVVPVEGVLPLPPTFTLDQAGAAGLSYAIAADGLAIAGLRGEGQTVLVTGGAGGVGAAVAAISRWRGAKLIAAGLDADEAATVRLDLPDATVVVDGEDSLTEIVREATDGRGADIVYDTVGNPVFHEAAKALGTGGRMIVITATPGADVPFDLFTFYRTGGSLLTANSTRCNCAWTAGLLRGLMLGFESGALPPPRVELRMPLEEAASAFLAVQRGTRGRVVLAPGDS
jgi:NADPH:quinone reductase